MWAVLIVLCVVALAVFFKSDADLPLLFLPYEEKNSFDGKVIWITGASSGIGASLAETMVKAGATVIISARRVAQLESVADNCSRFGQKPYVLPLDVTDFDAHKVAYDNIIEKFGRIDSLVLNAGVSQRSIAIETPLSVTQDLMNLNFMSFVALTKVVLPSMVEHKNGQLVVISSLSGIIGTPLGSSYSASKFALHGYFNALRSEVSNLGVSISIVCPGPVESEISSKAFMVKEESRAVEIGKMPTERCTYLIAKCMYYKFMEVWISDQPFLTMTYLAQYAPFLNSILYARIFGPARIKVLETGGNVYDMKSLLFPTK